ncbi:MAG TPA: FtsX-like permease family protein [Gemmatimonadaceae bacterium]|nr:FtsX-like permease family protein [Gemmatimonadaceae bacterium]
MLLFVLALLQQGIDTTPPARPLRSIAIDERLAADAGLRVGDRVRLGREPAVATDSAVIAAIVARGTDPSEVARGEYHVRMHLADLQDLAGYGDRVDRFAIRAVPGRVDSAVDAINASAFGFRAYPSREIAVQTSKTFLVVSRFHRAIGVITIVASAIFLLCIMLLKVEERRRDVAALRLMGISRRTVVASVMVEAAAVSVLGSLAGIGLGAVTSAIVNWHYQGVYRTPLAFSLITPGIVGLAVGLSVALGLAAGYLAARRLVAQRPLALIGR